MQMLFKIEGSNLSKESSLQSGKKDSSPTSSTFPWSTDILEDPPTTSANIS